LTLTTHAIVGGAIVSLMPVHPLLGVCMAFASHFLLDAIPHWDYPIRSASMNPEIAGSMKYDRALFADMVTIGADALLGIVLALILFATQRIIILVLLGACAGILPDALQFAYMRFPRQPLASLQRFHQWSHTSHKLSKPLLGVLSQSTFVVAFVMIVRALIP
jgi:hypothetical protein